VFVHRPRRKDKAMSATPQGGDRAWQKAAHRDGALETPRLCCGATAGEAEGGEGTLNARPRDLEVLLRA
jgi:hypothetical protein